MKRARDRVEYERAFAIAVDSLNLCWNQFYKECGERFEGFKTWVQPMLSTRNTDPLLLYLQAARHKVQHDRLSLGWTERMIQITGTSGFGLHGLKIFPDRSYDIQATSMGNSDAHAELVELPSKPFLQVIENRDPRSKKLKIHTVPTEHLGRPFIGNDPVDVATAGFTFYEHVLNEARHKFGPS